MKKIYQEPLLELMKIQINDALLTPSTFVPEDPIGEEVVDDDP